MDKVVHIHPKVTVVARLEFELAYLDNKIQHISREEFIQGRKKPQWNLNCLDFGFEYAWIFIVVTYSRMVVVGALTHCAQLHSVSDMKATHINL